MRYLLLRQGTVQANEAVAPRGQGGLKQVQHRSPLREDDRLLVLRSAEDLEQLLEQRRNLGRLLADGELVRGRTLLEGEAERLGILDELGVVASLAQAEQL